MVNFKAPSVTSHFTQGKDAHRHAINDVNNLTDRDNNSKIVMK